MSKDTSKIIPLGLIVSEVKDRVVGLDYADMRKLTKTEAKKDFLSKEAFDKFDKDGSGNIDKDELSYILHCLGQNPTSLELQDIIDEFDNTSRNGKLTYDEYCSVIKKFILTDEEIEVQLRQAFVAFDHDGSGTLNLSEIKYVLTGIGEDRLSDKQVDAMMKKMDTNGDGVLSIDECVRYLCWKLPS